MIEEVGTAFAVYGFLAVFGVLVVVLLVLMIVKKGICAALKFEASFQPAQEARAFEEVLLKAPAAWSSSRASMRSRSASVAPAPLTEVKTSTAEPTKKPAKAKEEPKPKAGKNKAQAPAAAEAGAADETKQDVDQPASPPPPPPKRDPFAMIVGSKIVITKRIHFGDKSAALLDSSSQVLDDVAEVLKTHPNLKRVRVESHVDETGMTEREQLDLSKAQAHAVVAALVLRGVEELRVIPEGFGNTLCFAPSDTSEGRALNRRMDFLIVDDDANPKGMKRLSSSGRLGDLATGSRRNSQK